MNNETLKNVQTQFNTSELMDSLNYFNRIGLLARTSVPYSHRRVADNYIIIKRVYKFQAVQSKVSSDEYNLLKKYDFKPLEQTSINQVNDEITYLKKWSLSNNEFLRRDADNIIQIRVKELKYIISSRYTSKTKELENGYKAFEHYLEEITKYY